MVIPDISGVVPCWAGGNCPPNLGLAPERDTASAYKCEKERSVAFKIHPNAFPAGDLPRTLLGR